MKPLTLEMAIEKEMTPIQCVQYYRPDLSEKECRRYLWQFTCFPLDNKKMLDQLNEQLNK